MTIPSDIEIANGAKPRPIVEVARDGAHVAKGTHLLAIAGPARAIVSGTRGGSGAAAVAGAFTSG